MATIFPLPSVATGFCEQRADLLSRSVRLWIFLRNSLLGMARAVVWSLDQCAGAALRGSWRPPGRSFTPHEPVQRASVEGFSRRPREARLPPRQSSQEAHRELLKVQNLEDDVLPGVAPFEWNKLKLQRDSWDVKPVPIEQVAPTQVSSVFRRPRQSRLSCEDAGAVAADSPAPAPCWNVRLASERALREAFFKAFGFAGISFVKEKGNRLQLVLDGRSTNLAHLLPSYVSLASASAWAELDISAAGP